MAIFTNFLTIFLRSADYFLALLYKYKFIILKFINIQTNTVLMPSVSLQMLIHQDHGQTLALKGQSLFSGCSIMFRKRIKHIYIVLGKKTYCLL